MKVAVCFSGTIRSPENGFNSLKLISPNDDIKVFGHTWTNLNDEKDYPNSVLDSSTESNFDVFEKYNFESLLIENYKFKKVHFKKMYDYFNFKPHDISVRTDLGIISMFYSIYRSNSLKREYELLNNMKFDKVIRIRFDSNFQNKNLDLNDILGNLCIPSGNDWLGGINDQFAVGSSQDMDVYCDLYNSFSIVRHIPYHPECILEEYLKIKNIQITRFDFQVTVNSSRLSWDQR
jgi:hypothetical protein